MSDLILRPGGGPKEAGVPKSWCGPHFERVGRHPLLLERTSELILEAFIADPRVLLFCQADPVTGLTGDEPTVLAALEHFSPVCCFLGDERFTKLWQLAAFGRPSKVRLLT